MMLCSRSNVFHTYRFQTFRHYCTRYTKTHEWIKFDSEKNIGTCGISEKAREDMGEIVFIDFSKVDKVNQEDLLADVESVKTAQQILAPVSGNVIKWNNELPDNLDLINETPTSDGWICKIKLSSLDELDSLMNEKDYMMWNQN